MTEIRNDHSLTHSFIPSFTHSAENLLWAGHCAGVSEHAQTDHDSRAGLVSAARFF